jgi:hypothetical protein
MADLRDFIEDLLNKGSIRYSERPAAAREPEPEAVALLQNAYMSYRLEVAGPLIPFDAATAQAAAELVRQAGWFLVSHEEPESELEKHIVLPGPASSAAQHLNADLMLRYLPQLHRRARALNADDLLTRKLTTILRQWPLSGVLSDIEEGPTVPLLFDDHSGLCMMYAERLELHNKPAWLPDGPAMEYIRWVRQELGKVAAETSESK